MNKFNLIRNYQRTNRWLTHLCLVFHFITAWVAFGWLGLGVIAAIATSVAYNQWQIGKIERTITLDDIKLDVEETLQKLQGK